MWNCYLTFLLNLMAERDYFRESFNYYKQRDKADVLKSVIDVDSAPLSDGVSYAKFLNENSDDPNCLICKNLGLHPHQNWNTFTHKDLDGFFLIRNPFFVDGQKIWIKKCLASYPLDPAVTNLHLCNSNLPSENYSKCLDKLSWVTLGYHYNWEDKTYDSKNSSTFPDCLSSLSRHIALCMMFDKFKPDAAIINYYNKKSKLGIHNDHSEKALDQPIIATSFGQTAIFLIGSSTRSDKPLPILLRSGDVVIMSGKSRLSYHAVPAMILDSANRNSNDQSDIFSNYIHNHRINISVRQVF